MAFLKIAGSLLLTSTAALCQVSTGGFEYADQCTGSDVGAQIMDCQNKLPTANGYKVGTIILPNTSIETGEAAWSTPVVLGPGVNLIGQGLFASSFNCTVAGDCLRHDASGKSGGANAHSVLPSTVYQGFTITGNSSANQNIFHFLDAQGVTVRDVAADAANEPGGACFWLEDVNWWTERNQFDNVSTLYGCNIGWRFSAQSSLPYSPASFGYNNFLDIKYNTSGPQTAFSFENDTYLYGGTLRVRGNKGGVGSRIIHMQDTAIITQEEIHFTGEENGSGGYFLDITSPNNQLLWNGEIINGGATANNIAAGAIVSHTLDGGLFHVPVPSSLGDGLIWSSSYTLPEYTDLNNIRSCGYYTGVNLLNAPSTLGEHNIRVQVICSNNQTYLTQSAYNMEYTNLTPRIFQRVLDNGSWGAWREVAWVDQLPHGFTGTKMAGSCVLVIQDGVITNVTGC